VSRELKDESFQPYNRIRGVHHRISLRRSARSSAPTVACETLMGH
jgi:hypothetical protein